MRISDVVTGYSQGLCCPSVVVVCSATRFKSRNRRGAARIPLNRRHKEILSNYLIICLCQGHPPHHRELKINPQEVKTRSVVLLRNFGSLIFVWFSIILRVAPFPVIYFKRGIVIDGPMTSLIAPETRKFRPRSFGITAHRSLLVPISRIDNSTVYGSGPIPPAVA